MLIYSFNNVIFFPFPPDNHGLNSAECLWSAEQLEVEPLSDPHPAYPRSGRQLLEEAPEDRGVEHGRGNMQLFLQGAYPQRGIGCIHAKDLCVLMTENFNRVLADCRDPEEEAAVPHCGEEQSDHHPRHAVSQGPVPSPLLLQELVQRWPPGGSSGQPTGAFRWGLSGACGHEHQSGDSRWGLLRIRVSSSPAH